MGAYDPLREQKTVHTKLELPSSYLRLAFSQKCFFESQVDRAKVETNKSALKRLLALHT